MIPIILEIEEYCKKLHHRQHRVSWRSGAYFVYDGLVKDKHRWDELRKILAMFVDEDKVVDCVREIEKIF